MLHRALFLCLILTLPASGFAQDAFRFVAFGDMPYCTPSRPEACAEEEARVARLMRDINAATPAFSVFVGDTKGGSEICSDERVLRAFSWMSLARHPLIYTPGDNEWTDCWQTRAGRFDPLERLALLRARFFPDRRSLGGENLELTRQADIDTEFRLFVENARWVRGDILFATLHVTGSNNNRPTEPGERPASNPPPGALEEFQTRDAANRAWLRASFAEAQRISARAVVLMQQADMYYAERCGRGQRSGFMAMRAALEEQALAFGKPVLLIHGDSHVFLREPHGPSIPNLTRLMVPGAQDVRAVLIEVGNGPEVPWRFEAIGPTDRVATNPC